MVTFLISNAVQPPMVQLIHIFLCSRSLEHQNLSIYCIYQIITDKKVSASGDRSGGRTTRPGPYPNRNRPMETGSLIGYATLNPAMAGWHAPSEEIYGKSTQGTQC